MIPAIAGTWHGLLLEPWRYGTPSVYMPCAMGHNPAEANATPEAWRIDQTEFVPEVGVAEVTLRMALCHDSRSAVATGPVLFLAIRWSLAEVCLEAD
jgi:hypothetical protein